MNSTSRTLVICGAISLAMVFGGCAKKPQIGAANRKLLQALQTAASAKKSDWLKDVESRIAEQRQKKEMSDEEFNAIEPIIKKAKSGDWKQANRDAIALCEAQKPTAQELEKFYNRKK